MTDSTTSEQQGRLGRLRQHARGAGIFAAGVLAGLAALLLAGLIAPAPPPLSMEDVQQAMADAAASATPAPAASALVYDVIRPSLVLIQVGGAEDDLSGIGSGVVVNADGDILTSLHVVEGAEAIRLTFADGSESVAQVVAAQPENDIAVLRAAQPPAQIFPATLGNPGAMRVGDDAFVVGHPLGLYGSMSAGVISGFDRSFRPPGSERLLSGLIQIDAAVNPGNSGGPLLNRSGEVIGIVAGLVNPTEQRVFIGLGFAVPITTAGGAAGMPPY